MKINQAEFVKSATRRSHFPGDVLPQAAFAGRSNVGKSTLLNALARHRQLARASRTPGRTQQINFFIINGSFYFVDLPGYGFAKAPLSVKKTWSDMIGEYLKDNASLRVLFWLLDARRVPSEGDREMLALMETHQIPFAVAVTKADKLSRGALARQVEVIRKALSLPEEVPFIPCSAKTGAGLDDLLRVLEAGLNPQE